MVLYYRISVASQTFSGEVKIYSPYQTTYFGFVIEDALVGVGVGVRTVDEQGNASNKGFR